MLCSYCLRLFTFTQAVQPYTPKPKRGLRAQGADNLNVLRIEAQSASSSSAPARSPNFIPNAKSNIEVYKDTKDVFSVRELWWKTQVGEGLKSGETHAPRGECQICDMIFSNVSGSFVEALVGKGKGEVGFVYQLKGKAWEISSVIPEAVVSVWLEVGEKLLPMVKLKVVAQNYVDKFPSVFPKLVESTYTGSVETLSLAASWIKQCNGSHRRCNHLRSKETPRLPSRLIDVGTSDRNSKCRLWIPEEGVAYEPYISLSYRWGQSPTILLTQASLLSLCEELPIDLLPKTNQDAIHITRFLGIRYLWIDALCIIQDLETDWDIESENMGNIYKNSYCTISASMATTGDYGCFINRRPLQARFQTQISRDNHPRSKHLPGTSPRKLEKKKSSTNSASMISKSSSDISSPRKLPIKAVAERDVEHLPRDRLTASQARLLADRLQKGTFQNPRSRQLRRNRRELQRYQMALMGEENPLLVAEMTIRTFQTDLWTSEVDASPLSRRAWTLQERLLSPRILHFGKTQLFWECQTSKACETWPQPAVKSIVDDKGRENEFELTSNSNLVLGGVVVFPFSEHWDEIIQLYTDANLTRPEDKLVAISGLVRENLRETKDKYYAGLWGNDFARNLLWYLPFPQRKAPSVYRAPSWSWASVDGRVACLAKRLTPEGIDRPTAASSITTIRTTGVDGKQSSTGQIKDGFCRISGPLRGGLRYERQGSNHHLVMSEVLSAYDGYVDFFPDSILKTSPEDLACLPILYHRDARAHLDIENKGADDLLSGLVIQPTGDFRDEYRRVGVFQISEKSGRAWFEEDELVIREVTIV